MPNEKKIPKEVHRVTSTPSGDIYQLKAISERGDVLLEAGAGAGKTFVLIEHLIQIIEDQRRTLFKEWGEDQLAWQRVLRSFLSSMVLMTFTRKATAEMQIRLMRRVQKEIEKGEHQLFWQLVESLLGQMTVATIHSFCLKLIRQGTITELSPDEEIITDSQNRYKLKRLLQKWLERELPKKEELHYLVLNFDLLVETIEEIFNWPSLRYLWRTPPKMVDQETFFTQLRNYSPVKEFFKKKEFIIPDKHQDKSWARFLLQIVQMQKGGLQTVSHWSAWFSFFDSLDRLPSAPKSDDCIEINHYWPHIKQFRDFLVKHNKQVMAFFALPPEQMQNYCDLIYQMIHSIEQDYFSFGGITFSDLEYLLLLQLDHPDFFPRIQNHYQYIIVDEFQDVSASQFLLIQKMINDDTRRLFAVGDIKQAIYGFRGGELDVFLQLQGKVKNPLCLIHNYRSAKEVVEHNNHFFDFIFRRGLKFQGEESLPMTFTAQKAVQTTTGVITKISLDLDRPLGRSWSRDEVNLLEAQLLRSHIRTLLQEGAKEITVLYKTVFPIRSLFPLLLEDSISFVAQMKVAQSELPLIIIFNRLLAHVLQKEKSDLKRTRSYIMALLHCMDLNGNNLIEEHLVQFLSDSKLFNVITAFYRFLFHIGLSGCFYEFDLQMIGKIYYSVGGDLFLLYQEIQQMEKNRLTIDYQSGERPVVKLMSAHSAKGLQFEHVLLGGIYTNDKTPPDLNLIGKWPGSFAWSDGKSRKRLKTPSAILESLENNEKGFAESKRLLYVAATRAQNSLSWVALPLDKIKFKHSGNCWYEAFFVFEQNNLGKTLYKEKLYSLSVNQLKMEIPSQLPLYFTDPIGLKMDAKRTPSLLGMVSELATTRLAALAICPYKFYLQSLCDLDEELETLKSILPLSSLHFTKVEGEGHSSSERGTRVHQIVSQMIKYKIPLSDLEIKEEDRKAIYYAHQLIKEQTGRYLLTSEDLFKFSFQGVMITGAPDLLLRPVYEKDLFEIWDFKTGGRHPYSEKGYHLQLLFYALATYQLGLCPKKKRQKLSLLYLDLQEIVSFEYGYDEVTAQLTSYWSMLGNLDNKEKNACPTCEYSMICHITVKENSL